MTILKAFLCVGISLLASTAIAEMPRFDHIVIVVEANRSFSVVQRVTTMPYIHALEEQGATFTQWYGLGQPGEPNYIALFSGSRQGVHDEHCEHSFHAPNLATELIAAGLSFGGYSEFLPAVGSKVCRAAMQNKPHLPGGHYVRRHNPWSMFTNVPAGVNMPLTSFPSDYSKLPTVSFVSPVLENDMHSGPPRRADAWLRTNLDGYIQWAKTHNSLFILTWDEGGSQNHVTTIFVGAGVKVGQYDEFATHYDIPRTITKMYGLAPLGTEAERGNPILGLWE